jgi:hypothetical protein
MAEDTERLIAEMQLLRTLMNERLGDIHTTLRQMNQQLNNMNK